MAIIIWLTVAKNPTPISQSHTTPSGQTGSSDSDPVATAAGQSQITPQAGRQDQLNPPQFAASDGGENWRCVASGHGQRRTQEGQRVAHSGALRHVGAINVMGRDLPALHPRHSDCLVTVRRRND
ncbi:hypothetical protein [Yoonia sediminilitoris]|uniref:hypothetical protein n=1 Tax=Yoonia sediminilitoris TaxID=1286148 RepID=UPI00145513D1